jgi:uncharacterized membrane protein YiaA
MQRAWRSDRHLNEGGHFCFMMVLHFAGVAAVNRLFDCCEQSDSSNLYDKTFYATLAIEVFFAE